MEPTPIHSIAQELVQVGICQENLRKDDEATLKTVKWKVLGIVLSYLNFTWGEVINAFRAGTPVHPAMMQELAQFGDEEVAAALVQAFVRNDKLNRILKGLERNGLNVNQALAVDGLVGNVSNGPVFEHKQYLGNLRFGYLGSDKSFFDEEPEYRRRHTQCVREMYKILKDPTPRQVYYILKGCFEEMNGKGVKSQLPEIELEMEVDKKELAKCVSLYIGKMGKENIQNMYKSLKIRGEKRTSSEREVERPYNTK